MAALEFRDYLSLLRELASHMEQLTQVEQEKAAFVRQDDLEGLDRCMKREQAMSLSLRGLEQKRQTLQSALGLNGVALSHLPQHAPEEYREEAKEVAHLVQDRHALFQGAFEVARNTLECSLHEVEKIVAALGGAPVPGPGYGEDASGLRGAPRTDFRA